MPGNVALRRPNRRLFKRDLQRIYDSMGDNDIFNYINWAGGQDHFSKGALGNFLTQMPEGGYLEEDPVDTAAIEQERQAEEAAAAAQPQVAGAEAPAGAENAPVAPVNPNQPENPQEEVAAEQAANPLNPNEQGAQSGDGQEALSGEIVTPEETQARQRLAVQAQSGKPETRKQKRARKIAEAKFPRLRTWWENFKAQFGSERTPEEKIANAAFPRARAAWEGTKTAVGEKGKELLVGKEFENFTPEQQKLISKLGQLGIQGLEKGGGEFEPIEQEYLNKFKTKIAPSIAERYAGQNALNSGAFRGEIASAGKDLASTLAALKSGHQTQQQGHFANLAQLGITPKFPNATYDPNSGGVVGGLSKGVGEAIPSLLMKALSAA